MMFALAEVFVPYFCPELTYLSFGNILQIQFFHYLQFAHPLRRVRVSTRTMLRLE